MTASRSYHSPRRREVAAATRGSILQAARELFAARGYGRVTVADIARQAGVAAKTVYASAGGKADILSELIGQAAEDSGARETLAAARRATGLAEAMRILARGTRAGNESHQDAIEIMYAAMPVHDDAQALWEQGTSLYREVLDGIAAHLSDTGLLSPDLDPARAADMLWFCFGPASWRTLTRECHWTWDEAERWLASQAEKMLAPPAAAILPGP
jgi:AcrR family transcriptional regulator